MRFRKKPVEVEAVQINDILNSSLVEWPEWVREAYATDVMRLGVGEVSIKTLEGIMTGQSRDMLVKGIKGELYCVREDIWVETYEYVGE